MLQDKIIMTAMERAGAMNWPTAANSIMAAGKKAVAVMETVAGEGDDTGVLPVEEMMEAARGAVSYACDRCKHKNICMSSCKRNCTCAVDLFLEDLKNLLKTE